MDNLQEEIDKENELEDKYTKLFKKYVQVTSIQELQDEEQYVCPNATYTLCRMHSVGAFGLPKSDARLYDLCRESAESGNALAQYLYANLCFNDKLEECENLPEAGHKEIAFHWWEKSAKQGYLEAQIKVADCYLAGIGVAKCEQKALEWYLKSSKPKLDLAQNTLENDNSTLIQDNRELIDTVKRLLKDKRELIETNTKLMNDIEPKKEQPKKEQSKLKNWFKKLKGKHNDK